MYLYHFGLKELPFTLTPNTRLFCELPTFGEALNLVSSAIECGEGFVKIVGEVGTGKTMLGNKLAQRLRPNHPLIHITNPQITPESLYLKIRSALKAKTEQGGQAENTDIELVIQSTVSKYNTLVILVDESQSLGHDTLEAIRFLSNIETEEKKLVQIVLLGQPELDERLKMSNLRQLDQRIAFGYHLKPLTRSEVEHYVNYRLERVCMYPNSLQFTPRAIKALFQYSKGLPRKINVLCHRALMIGYAEGVTLISRRIIALAEQENKPQKKSWLKSAMVRFSLTSVLITSVLQLYGMSP